MKTVYANSRHPRLVRWSCVIAFIVGLGLYILYMTLEGDAKYLLYLACMSLPKMQFHLQKTSSPENWSKRETAFIIMTGRASRS